MTTPLRRSNRTPTDAGVPPADTPGSTPVGAERAWVAGIAQGDECAFEAMFRRYNRDLYRFALRLLGSADEAEDAVQGVFVAIWQNRAGWSVRGALKVYLYSAVRNRALQQLRNARRRHEHRGDVLQFTTASVSEPLLGPDAQVEHADFAAALRAAVDALPPRGREAFLLTREHGMTYAEAAATMGISPQTVMVHIGRALATLRKALGPFLLVLLAVR